jgi:hypothetical protein
MWVAETAESTGEGTGENQRNIGRKHADYLPGFSGTSHATTQRRIIRKYDGVSTERTSYEQPEEDPQEPQRKQLPDLTINVDTPHTVQSGTSSFTSGVGTAGVPGASSAATGAS